jgi:hypothetical protein
VTSDYVNRSEWLPDGTWRDPDCFECGGEGAPCCEPPDGPSPWAGEDAPRVEPLRWTDELEQLRRAHPTLSAYLDHVKPLTERIDDAETRW